MPSRETRKACQHGASLWRGTSIKHRNGKAIDLHQGVKLFTESALLRGFSITNFQRHTMTDVSGKTGYHTDNQELLIEKFQIEKMGKVKFYEFDHDYLCDNKVNSDALFGTATLK